MKKISAILCMLILFQLTTTYAMTFVDSLPGGKNYIDPDNLVLDDVSVWTAAPFLIKGDTDYTLTIPGDAKIGLADVYVYGDVESYLIGSVLELSTCTPGQDYVVCTFHTDPLETHIHVRVEARDVDLYHAYYGYQDFQLEEGLISTSYEPYEIPYVDTTDPEFSGSAAFIKSYKENISLDVILAEHVVVYDEIDGDLSNSIVVTSDPYTASMNTVGTYVVGLSVTDQSNNTATFDFTIIVNDPYDPIMSGPDEIDISVDDMTPLTSIISTHYAATDDYDGVLAINIQSDAYTASMDTVGSYPVTLVTADSSGNTVTKTVLLHVKDMTKPTLESSNDITVVMSDPKTLPDIINGLVVHDNYSMDSALVYTIYSDNYTGYEHIRGTYPVELHVTDESNNTLIMNLSITIEDDVAPIITGPASISTSYITPYSMAEIMDMLSVTDNHDGLVIGDIQITQNTYENRSTLVGEFLIEFQVMDESLNSTFHQLTIQVVDDQEPVFYVDSHLVTVTPQAMFQPVDALNMLVANGVVPAGEYEINVLNDEYTKNASTPGTYDFTVLFTNRNGESYEHAFDITVSSEETESNNVDWVTLVRNIGAYSSMVVMAFVVFRKYKK